MSCCGRSPTEPLGRPEVSVPAGRPAPVFSVPNSGTSQVSIASAAASGAYTLQWTIVSGLCTVTDDVVIDFGNVPDVVPPMTGNICGEVGNLPAPVPSIGTGTWTVVSGPGPCAGGACPIAIADINSPTSSVSLNGPGFVYGTYNLEWRVVSGICAPSFNTAAITFNQAASVIATDITNVCLQAGGSAVPLTGTFGGGATNGAWVNVNGTGAIGASTVAGNTVTATYTSSLADYNLGTPIRVKLVANPPVTSSCPAVEQEITVTFDRTPVALATTPLRTCVNFIQLEAENPIPFGATGVWTGPLGITFDNINDPRTIARNLPAAPSSG